uniref:Receptor-type tyrosine-protein phosphatase N2-like n=1 Tax=Salmo trutta TaxID=8032 RepID=A0A673ZXV2_SALTR
MYACMTASLWINDIDCILPYYTVYGMFGRCHSTPVPVAEVYTYDVSPSVVQRFRTLLQKLTHRGKYSTVSLAAAVFIQKVLKNVGRHNVDVDDLSLKDLDQLSTLITDALQGTPAPLALTPHPCLMSSLAVSLSLNYLSGSLVFGPHSLPPSLLSSPSLPPSIPLTSGPVSPLMSPFLSSVCDRNVMCGSAHPHLTGVGINSVGTFRRKASIDELYFSLHSALQTDEGLHLMEILTRRAKLQMTDFLELSVVGPAVTFRVRPNAQNVSTADVANVAVHQKDAVEKEAKVVILEAGITDRSQINQIPTKYSTAESTKYMILTVVSILCIVAVLLASTVVYCLRHRSHHKLKEKLTNLGTDTGSDATSTYQELCRQRMSVKPPAERPEPMHSVSSRLNSVSSQFSDGGPMVSPSARSSTSSWSEEPVHSNMDISTGHMILSYMEDHLKNKNRLEKEWEALCAYQAEPNASTTGLGAGNTKKNRSNAVVAYDHSRITLKVENSHSNSDYINASPIMDHDPRNPAYIATQGPLPSTVADFWQMVWENGCVVIVMLTPLTESGVKQCYHYWPDEGSNLYHIYEVNLVSEHIWCDDFLVRSFYLKNMQTNETRTVTQFHFLTWLNQNVPGSSRTLLDFRRKVNKCYRGRSCPIIVHCSDGAGRSGTYILMDMVLNKMAKGAKEIDIAATLEHLRDQRPAMVQTKEQFEFALTAVAEEVNAILKALPQ